MFYRGIRFNTNQERNQVRDNLIGAKELECAGKLSTGPYNSKPDTLGNSRARSTIIHRTVRCQRSNGSLRANGRLVRRNNDEQCRTKVRGHRTVFRCSKTTKASTIDQLRTLTVALKGPTATGDRRKREEKTRAIV
jgi:hypothetical protein